MSNILGCFDNFNLNSYFSDELENYFEILVYIFYTSKLTGIPIAILKHICTDSSYIGVAGDTNNAVNGDADYHNAVATDVDDYNDADDDVDDYKLKRIWCECTYVNLIVRFTVELHGDL